MVQDLSPRAARLRPSVVALDVIETLFPLAPLRTRFEAVGLPGGALAAWFAQFLRDALVLDVTGVYRPFKEVAEGTLKSLLTAHCGHPDPAKIKAVLEGFAELSPHPDVGPGLEALRRAGHRLVTLTNGAAASTDALLKRAGFREFIERCISIDEVGHWKPHESVYRYAARTLEVEPRRLALVAAHPWDIHGASRAGLTTAFIARTPFVPIMDAPAVSGSTLGEVARGLAALPAG